jgi:hypothetical protein
MSDEQPFYAPNRPPAKAPSPRPREHLWAIRRGGRQFDCELLDHSSWGWRCCFSARWNGSMGIAARRASLPLLRPRTGRLGICATGGFASAKATVTPTTDDVVGAATSEMPDAQGRPTIHKVKFSVAEQVRAGWSATNFVAVVEIRERSQVQHLQIHTFTRNTQQWNCSNCWRAPGLRADASAQSETRITIRQTPQCPSPPSAWNGSAISLVN